MANQRKTSKTLNIALWAGQAVLGLMFAYAGVLKTFQPIEQLSEMLPWAAEYSPVFVRFVGLADMVGGVGVLLPALVRVKPGLTWLAALGIAAIMVLAIGFHAIRGEYQAFPMNIVMGSIAAFVAWGRYKKAPIGRS